jgi:hypothetical protein
MKAGGPYLDLPLIWVPQVWILRPGIRPISDPRRIENSGSDGTLSFFDNGTEDRSVCPQFSAQQEPERRFLARRLQELK